MVLIILLHAEKCTQHKLKPLDTASVWDIGIFAISWRQKSVSLTIYNNHCIKHM